MNDGIKISSMDNGTVRILIAIEHPPSTLELGGNPDWASRLADKIKVASEHAREILEKIKNER